MRAKYQFGVHLFATDERNAFRYLVTRSIWAVGQRGHSATVAEGLVELDEGLTPRLAVAQALAEISRKVATRGFE